MLLGLSAGALGAVLSQTLHPPTFVMAQDASKSIDVPGVKFKKLNVLLVCHPERECNVFTDSDRILKAEIFKSKLQEGKVRMLVSPHMHTCQTAHSLIRALKSKSFVIREMHEDLVEVPGVFPKTKVA